MMNSRMKYWKLCSGLGPVVMAVMRNLAATPATAVMGQIMGQIMATAVMGQIMATEEEKEAAPRRIHQQAPAVETKEGQDRELGEVDVGVDGDAGEAALVEAQGAEVEGVFLDLAWAMPSIAFAFQLPAPQYQCTVMTEEMFL